MNIEEKRKKKQEEDRGRKDHTGDGDRSSDNTGILPGAVNTMEGVWNMKKAVANSIVLLLACNWIGIGFEMSLLMWLMYMWMIYG